jgi:diguanylate cyclase (GGDEF)-like protein
MANATAPLAAVAEEMTRLRDAYLERLPAELSELKALADSLAGSNADLLSLEEMQHRLHKLAGSGGTFGLKKLSEESRRIEQQTQRWLDGSWKNVDFVARRAFTASVSALRNALLETPTGVISTLSAPGQESEPGMAKRIWLVEDDVLLGQELVRLLEQFGFDVRLFIRIRDAEAAARTGRPDILIMDVMFSQEGENSTEVLNIRPSLQALGCPLIFMSSQDHFQSRVRAARLGAVGYMLKPLDVPRLVEHVERICDMGRAPPQRVLIVDDDLDLAAHYQLALLGAGMDVELLNQPADIIEQVAAFRPELVLMDMHMPGYSGPELAAVIRQHDNWVTLPIVYLSAETDFDKQLQALGRGADDFLTKPISDAQLIAAVKVRVERSRQLADQISKDSLTGLLKHANIKEAAEIEVLRSRRNGTGVALAMLDIDHFKTVNDTYGHAVGDLVIKSLATLLRQRLRQSDVIGRYGGEEFVAVLPECDPEAARLIFEDIRQRFAALQFTHGGQTFGCTVSAGVACSSMHPDTTAAELLVIADQALYAAKRAGRNQVRP